MPCKLPCMQQRVQPQLLLGSLPGRLAWPGLARTAVSGSAANLGCASASPCESTFLNKSSGSASAEHSRRVLQRSAAAEGVHTRGGAWTWHGHGAMRGQGPVIPVHAVCATLHGTTCGARRGQHVPCWVQMQV